MRRLITKLPARWRMTPDEENTIETMAGIAARKIKVPVSMARSPGGRAWHVFPLTISNMDEAGIMLARLAAMRPNYERRNRMPRFWKARRAWARVRRWRGTRWELRQMERDEEL